MAIRRLIFDLDNTLVDSDWLKPTRDARRWQDVRTALPRLNAFPGVDTMLRTLVGSGVKLAIVTHSPRWYAKALAGRIVPGECRIVAYGDLGGRLKPSAYGYQVALEGDEPQNAFVVGDALSDLRAADAASIRAGFAGWSRSPALDRSQCKNGCWHHLSRPTDVLDVIVELTA